MKFRKNSGIIFLCCIFLIILGINILQPNLFGSNYEGMGVTIDDLSGQALSEFADWIVAGGPSRQAKFEGGKTRAERQEFGYRTDDNDAFGKGVTISWNKLKEDERNVFIRDAVNRANIAKDEAKAFNYPLWKVVKRLREDEMALREDEMAKEYNQQPNNLSTQNIQPSDIRELSQREWAEQLQMREQAEQLQMSEVIERQKVIENKVQDVDKMVRENKNVLIHHVLKPESKYPHIEPSPYTTTIHQPPNSPGISKYNFNLN